MDDWARADYAEMQRKQMMRQIADENRKIAE